MDEFEGGQVDKWMSKVKTNTKLDQFNFLKKKIIGVHSFNEIKSGN